MTMDELAVLLDVLSCAEEVVSEYLSHEGPGTHQECPDGGYCGLPNDILSLQRAINAAQDQGF